MINTIFSLLHRWLCHAHHHRCFLLSFLVAAFFESFYFAIPLQAQRTNVLPQKSLHRWNIPSGNYSGITPLGGQRYAVVSDKAPTLGYYVWNIQQDSVSGQVIAVDNLGFHRLSLSNDADTSSLATLATPHSTSTSSDINHVPNTQGGTLSQDVEDLVFDAHQQRLWIANEGSQTITAFSLASSTLTDSLYIPDAYNTQHIFGNLGFEALTQDIQHRGLWTVTEAPLRIDAPARPEQLPPTAPLFLRLLYFSPTEKTYSTLPYRMQAPQLSRKARYYLQGIPALCALPNGSLLVMERELSVPKFFIGAKTSIRLLLIRHPHTLLQPNDVTADALPLLAQATVTEEVAHWTTRLSVFSRSFANYEGMCLGTTLTDGRQTVLCINDAQGGAGRLGVHLKDFIRVVVLPQSLSSH